LPARSNAFEEKRGKLPLYFVGESEVELGGLVGFAVTEEGLSFARIMIAVVVEKDNLTADLALQSAGRLQFGDEESLWEKPTGLLAKPNDWG
jgi:hypothetical protein